MAEQSDQLMFISELENIECGEFESVYTIHGKPILPPMMTDWKRLEMMRLRLCALTQEVVRERNKLTNVEKVEVSTNTDPGAQGPRPFVVMGRMRQKLNQSETMIYDHTANMVMQVSAPFNEPILMNSELMMEEAPPARPQRAHIVFAPEKWGTLESGYVAKLDPKKTGNFQPKEKAIQQPLRSATSPDLAKLQLQLLQRNPPEQALAIKSEPRIGHRPAGQHPNKAKNPSRIPKPIAQIVGSISKETKPQSALQARSNYDAKVASRRNNQVKNQVSPVKPKSSRIQSKTTNLNLPKSIRTPVPIHQRPGYVDKELKLQKDLLKSLVLRQAEENQRLQARMQQQQQGLIATMINDLNHVVEISNDFHSLGRALELTSSSTSSDPSQN
ncbi:uncharacterized protein LOC108111330 [Drosophila eugracilis]|uniref:uncharacterized protein LOC108111330 n=1 Tax=Drosophila eugracilis TaxID=29029 RepID=UPI0007E71030|nr:uncharacterized protein LOC108111330 [Drosophila eugracilis]